jgi:hypothetical protein
MVNDDEVNVFASMARENVAVLVVAVEMAVAAALGVNAVSVGAVGAAAATENDQT